MSTVGLSKLGILPDPGSGGMLFLVGISDGHLWYTEPVASTKWQAFDDIEGRAGELGTIMDADVNRGLILSIFAVNNAGGLYFTYLTGGGWKAFSDVKAAAGDPGTFTRVAVTTSLGLDVCGITSDGLLWHAIRQTTGTWVPFFDVTSQAGDRNVVQISCAAINGDLYLCAISDDGKLWLTSRPAATGTWTPFIDIERRAGKRGLFVDVECVNLHDELHVLAATDDGRLWHTVRGTPWTPFYDVKTRASDPGKIVRVGAGGGILSPSVLELAVVTSDGHLWHTDRHSDGTWSSFDDVEATAGERGDFQDVGVDATYVVP